MKKDTSALAVFAVLIVITIQCCTREVEREFLRIKTLPCEIFDNGALLKGEISNFKSLVVEEYGFMICDGHMSEYSEFTSICLGNEPVSNNYEYLLTSGLEEGKAYTYFAYAKSNDFLSIGSGYSFVSGGCDPPILTSFEPKNGFVGDSIFLYCTNLYGSGAEYSVSFNDIVASNVTRINDTTLVLKVPLAVTDIENTITASAFGEQSSYKEIYSLLTPDIISFTPTVVYPGDTVTITGNNFPENKSVVKVLFNKKKGVVLNSAAELITVLAPPPVDSINNIKVETISGQFDIADESIKILFPSGNDYMPKTGTFGDQVSIFGDAIGLYPVENIKFGTSIANILSVESNEIIVSVPFDLGACEALITINYESVGTIAFADPFTINPVEITGLSTSNIETGSALEIYGENFNPQNSLVRIGDQVVTPIEILPDRITVIISLWAKATVF